MNTYKTPGQILAEEQFARYKAADNTALGEATREINHLKRRLENSEAMVDKLLNRTLWQRICNDPI